MVASYPVPEILQYLWIGIWNFKQSRILLKHSCKRHATCDALAFSVIIRSLSSFDLKCFISRLILNGPYDANLTLIKILVLEISYKQSYSIINDKNRVRTRDLKSWPRPPTLPPVLRSGAQSQLSGTAATESMAVGNWARPGYKTAPSASDFCTCVGFEGDLQLSQTCFYHHAEREYLISHFCYHHI